MIGLLARLALFRLPLGGGRRAVEMPADRARTLAPSLVLLGLLAACEPIPERGGLVRQVPDGDPALGPALMRDYGCIACHTIPGVRGADAWVGPPLDQWARRIYIGGLVQNTPENLVLWIHDPQRIHPGSAMPTTGITLDEARHVAAYLYSLR